MSSTTTSGSPAMAAPIPPTFSYAQAAKGHKSNNGSASVLQSRAASGISTPAKEASSVNNTPSASVNGAATSSESGDKSVNGTLEPTTKSDQITLGSEPESKSTTLVNSLPASPSFGAASPTTLPKEDDLTFSAASPPELVWERNGHSGNGADKATEGSDNRRNKKSKKQKMAEKEADKEAEKEAEKEREEAERKLLVAAPPPAVNIWQQRKEAQALKVKPSPVSSQSPQSLNETPTMKDAAGKSAESKKKGKGSGGDEGDKLQSQTGTAKEFSTPSKGQKKSAEGVAKPKEEGSNKRTGPRGSRVNDKESEKPISNPLPPPVGDPISWPTPETALEEEKRKAQEKERPEKEIKDEPTAHKTRPKEKWVAVPYVPSVTWNTQLPPSRGGRGRGGARTAGRDSTSRGSQATNAGDKAFSASTTAANGPGESETRGRGSSTGTRSTSLPPAKRNSSASQAQGKPVAGSNFDRPKVGQASQTSKNDSNSSHEHQRASDHLSDNTKGLKPEYIRGASKESATDRKGDLAIRNSELSKDPSNAGKESSQARDRTEGRGDRGRGGFRGRGGHNGFPNGQPQPPQHTYTNGHGPQGANGYPGRQNSNPFSPGIQQAPFSNQYTQAPSRGGRGGSRSQSIPSTAIFPRFGPNGGPQLAPLQMPNSIYDYQPPMQTMSAVPYGGTNTNFELIAIVKMQLEYYFSIDNLCKDVFLRKHMDSQGFVFLNFIAQFKRLQQLFQGQPPTHEIEILKIACYDSSIIDIIVGEDHVDRIRRGEGWDKWVLEMSERDESVRTDGPAQHIRQDPREKLHYTPQMLPQQPFFPNGPDGRIVPNGIPHRGINGNGFQDSPVQLTGGAADFTPARLEPSQAPNGLSGPVSNGTYPGAVATAVDDRLQRETIFSDENVHHLRLVFRSPKDNSSTTPGVPFHGTSSRTFSHGSIDGNAITDELNERQGRTNGSNMTESSPTDVRRSRSPFAPLSPTRSALDNGPPVMWVKGHADEGSLSDAHTEPYPTVLAKALKSRDLPNTTGAVHVEMRDLYEFWSHFLIRNFNPKMYADFRKYAYEDAANNFPEGTKSLVDYYNQTLTGGKKVIPDFIAEHYVQLVRDEQRITTKPDDRLAFKALRAAWRNGALEMKSRKKIDNLIDADLKKELES